MLQKTNEYCKSRGFLVPLFAVGQTGTLVKETFNVGTFDDPFRQPDQIPAEIQVPQMVDICRSYSVYLKEHNADYLPNEALSWHPKLGIHAANIAPEFGVEQTRHLLRICEELGFTKEAERFIELSYESRKWEKWMLSDTQATDRDRAVVAGHYVFSTEEFKEIMSCIRQQCEQKGLDIDKSISEHLKMRLMRIMCCFGLYR